MSEAIFWRDATYVVLLAMLAVIIGAAYALALVLIGAAQEWWRERRYFKTRAELQHLLAEMDVEKRRRQLRAVSQAGDSR
jgi:hypothetical protein